MLRRWWNKLRTRDCAAEFALSSGEQTVADKFVNLGCSIQGERGSISSITGSDQLTDDDLKVLIDCQSLSNLDLQRSPITDNGMVHIGKIASLTRLNLGYTSVTANGLMHLRSLNNLHSLDLTGTSIVIDDAINHIQTLASLRWLDLRMTPMTESSKAAIEFLRTRNPNLKFHPLGLP